MTLLAILFPPLAVLLCGKPFQALINIPLTLMFWIPGVIHAIIVVGNYNTDKRQARLITAQQAATAAAISAQVAVNAMATTAQQAATATAIAAQQAAIAEQTAALHATVLAGQLAVSAVQPLAISAAQVTEEPAAPVTPAEPDETPAL